jgi:hypothetical protein
MTNRRGPHGTYSLGSQGDRAVLLEYPIAVMLRVGVSEEVSMGVLRQGEE